MVSDQELYDIRMELTRLRSSIQKTKCCLEDDIALINVTEDKICINEVDPDFMMYLSSDILVPRLSEVQTWVDNNLTADQKKSGTQVVFYLEAYTVKSTNVLWTGQPLVRINSFIINGDELLLSPMEIGTLDHNTWLYNCTYINGTLTNLIENWGLLNNITIRIRSADSCANFEAGFGLILETKENIIGTINIDYDDYSSVVSITETFDSSLDPSYNRGRDDGGSCENPDFIWTVNNYAIVTLSYQKLPSERISKTYTEIAALISGSLLLPGQQYLISDYQTVHTIPGTAATNTGPTEPLIVTAISANELAPIAYSTLYPNDIIYYHSGTDAINFPGSTKGYISRRIDTIQNNDIGTDWRHVKYRRYAINQATWDAGTTYAKGAVVKSTTTTTLYVSLRNTNLNNVVTDINWWRIFEWTQGQHVGIAAPTWTVMSGMDVTTDPLVYTDMILFNGSPVRNIIRTYKLMNTTFIGGLCDDNVIGDNFTNNVLGNNFQRNVIVADFYNNSIGGYFRYNNVSLMFYNNSISSGTVGNAISNNTFGQYFHNNSLGYKIQYNIIGSKFSNNSMGNIIVENQIGNYFESNIVYGGAFSYNNVANRCNNNTIGGSCQSNTIGNYLNNSVIGASFGRNTVGNGVGLNVGNNLTNMVIGNSNLYYQYNSFSLSDSNEAEAAVSYIDLQNGIAGKGQLVFNGGYADFLFDTAGVVTLLNHSANVFTTLQTGTNHVIIKDNGTNVRIVNEMGATLPFNLIIQYL
jgi:hypothetical protein